MIDPTAFNADQWLAAMVAAFAKAAAGATAYAITSLVTALGLKTEPDFQAIIPAYDKMLAIALLLLGGVVAFALLERLLGGASGAGWNLVGRVVTAVAIAFLGLPVIQYASLHAVLLAQVWDFDYVYRALDLFHNVQALYTNSPTPHDVATMLELSLAACISLLLALLVHVELILRAALILVTTTFVPLIAVLAIWPRFAGSLVHLAEFLFGLLAAKFVMATAIYVGYAVLVAGIPQGSRPDDSILVTGIGILAIAAFGPLLLVQGIRIGHHAAAPVARSWLAGAVGWGMTPLKGAGRLAGRGFAQARSQVLNSPGLTQAGPR